MTIKVWRYPVKVQKIWTPEIKCRNFPKMGIVWFFNVALHPKDGDGMANSVGPDQAAPIGAV